MRLTWLHHKYERNLSCFSQLHANHSHLLSSAGGGGGGEAPETVQGKHHMNNNFDN